MTRSQALIASVVAVTALGCGSLLDVDDFKVTRVDNPCAALEAPASNGCVTVGVTNCAAGFLPDGAGGCVPLQPAEPCPRGRLALPGSIECGEVGLLNCASGPFPTALQPIGAVLYVSPQAAAGGDGSKERPLRTVGEALEQAAGPLTLLLSRGEHRANVDVSERDEPVQLIGLCASQTSLLAEAGSPAVRFGDGSDGSALESLAIRGGSAGVVAQSTAELRLQSVWIHDVEGPGIEIQDVPGEASLELDHVLIENVLDVGLIASGAAVSFSAGVIRDVVPLREGGRALGLSVGASASFASADPSLRTAGSLELKNSTIEGTTQAALRVEESFALVKGSWIFDVSADALGFARGFDVRGSTTSTLPTRLELEGSLIEHSAEAGVRVWNASATIEDTTIREIATSQSGRCTGAGVGASFGLLVEPPAEDASEPRLLVRSSLIENVRGNVLTLEGGSARLETSRLSAGQGECSGAALAARASGTGAARLELVDSRVEGGSPAIDAPGSQISLNGAVFACASAELAFGAIAGAESSLCGCQNVWHTCDWRLPQAKTPSSAACEASADTTCQRLCLQKLGNQGAVAGATVWAFDRPEVPSRLSGSDGCVELPLVPRDEPFVVAAAAWGFGPGLAMAAPFDLPATEPARNTLIELSTFQAYSALIAGGVDLRRGTLVNVRVCSEPAVAGLVCPPLPGSTVELLQDPDVARLYFDQNNFPDANLTRSEGADVVFANVRPGAHRVKVIPPDGQRCTPNTWGWVDDEVNTFRIHVEPHFAQSVAEVVCTD